MITKGEPDLVSSCLCLKIVNSPPMCELHRSGEIHRWKIWTPHKYCLKRLPGGSSMTPSGEAQGWPTTWDLPASTSLGSASRVWTLHLERQIHVKYTSDPLKLDNVWSAITIQSNRIFTSGKNTAFNEKRGEGYNLTLAVITNRGQSWFECRQWTRLNTCSHTYWECSEYGSHITLELEELERL